MNATIKIACLMLLLLCPSLLSGRLLSANTPHRTGRFRIQFDQRSPLSTREEFQKRNLHRINISDYNINEITFEVLVPQNYKPDQPAALFIFISSGDSGSPPPSLAAALSRHGYIYIGANGVGNKQEVMRRTGTAIDAAYHMPKLYNIDPARIYVSGTSGGSRCASMIAAPFSDVFTGGGCYFIGCNNYWDAHGYQNHNWKTDKQIEQAKNNRFVFITGSKDFNKGNTQTVYGNHRNGGFKHCLYIEVPGLGHSMPPADTISEGLAFFDKVIEELKIQAYETGLREARARNLPAAAKHLMRAAAYGNDEAVMMIKEIKAAAAEETAKGIAMQEAKDIVGAREHLDRVVKYFGDDFAAEAKTVLDRMQKIQP